MQAMWLCAFVVGSVEAYFDLSFLNRQKAHDAETEYAK